MQAKCLSVNYLNLHCLFLFPLWVKYLSKCWAVKEAVVKAYGTGFTTPFSPCDIGYTSDGGKPYVRFSEKIHQSGLLNNKITHLSVSDELTHVIAFVIVENTKDK